LSNPISRAVEALWRPLRLAAREGFKDLERTENLGVALQRAATSLETVLQQPDHRQSMADYARGLGQFDQLPRPQRVRLVALGLRLCAQLQPAAAAPSPRGATGLGPQRGAADPGPGPSPRRLTARRPTSSDSDHAREPTAVDGLQSPVTLLRGVGARVAARLAARGIQTVEDLLYLLPLEYIDRREQVPVAQVTEARQVTTSGVVSQVSTRSARGRRMVEVALAESKDGPVLLCCVWFRAYPGLAQRFAPGQRVTVSGQVQRYRDQLQMTHPDLMEGDGGGLRCRYPEVEGVAPRLLERLCVEACQRFAHQVEQGVPTRIAQEVGLPTQAEAIRTLHLQSDEPDAAQLQQLQRGDHPAHRRLVFDDLFSMQLAVALRRLAWGDRTALPCELKRPTEEQLRRLLPFSLTGAQERVVAGIAADLHRQRPMHRLLQGDVGSGKTVVAFFAAAAAMDSGLQAAIMAPTEILARQHFQTMEPWVRALGWHAALITASIPHGVRESLLALADAGQIQLLVGTHALLGPRVNLPNLGLAVVDEQHRFGVLQRIRLRQRGADQPLPHLLLMTATPIPRSLALACFGDLDLSVLDEKPPGRRPPVTRLFVGRQRAQAYELVRRQLQQGRQAFVVCPLVEQSEKLQVADAVNTAEQLTQLFAEHRVGLVHGRLNAQQRDAVMDRFRRQEIDLLVATTVIEVGIDVPRASTMVVEHAERFGLAQLHQLRGRIGRNEEESLCLLLSDAAPDSPAGQRLEVMVRSHDGFEIAEADLQQRGPGEVFGTQQSGIPRFRFADLRSHMQLLSLAQTHAMALLERDPHLLEAEHEQARRVMRRRWEGIELVGEEAG